MNLYNYCKGTLHNNYMMPMQTGTQVSLPLCAVVLDMCAFSWSFFLSKIPLFFTFTNQKIHHQKYLDYESIAVTCYSDIYSNLLCCCHCFTSELDFKLDSPSTTLAIVTFFFFWFALLFASFLFSFFIMSLWTMVLPFLVLLVLSLVLLFGWSRRGLYERNWCWWRTTIVTKTSWYII